MAPQVRNLKKKCKNHDISIIIPPLGMTWVSKEAVWSTLVHLIGLGCCFPAKIEQTLKIFQKTVTFQWILIIFVVILNVFPFWLKKSQGNKQIIVFELVCFSGHPRHPPGWYNSGVKEMSARNPSVYQNLSSANYNYTC